MRINEHNVHYVKAVVSCWLAACCDSLITNLQDADELGAGNVEVPSWQIPDLVVRSLGKHSTLFS